MIPSQRLMNAFLLLSTNLDRRKMNKSSIPPSKKVYLKTMAKRKANISSLPNEIILKIFSHLEPSELLSAACVCRQWLELSKDNLIWKSVYERFVRKTSTLPDETPTSYWKDQCIKCGIERRNKEIFRRLKKQNQFNKLPSQIQNCIKKADIRWQLSLINSDDEEFSFRHNDLFLHETSLSVRWYSLEFPPVKRIKKLRLYSLSPVFYLKEGCAFKNSPCQRSLLLEYDVRLSDVIAKYCDVESGPIKCHVIADNLLVAVWKDGGEFAFISASLQYHRLMERCLLGSSDTVYSPPPHKPRRDDLDSRLGLYGYSCTLELRNQRTRIWMDVFRDVFSKNESGSDVHLTLVDPEDRVYHQVFSKAPSLPWKTELFKGVVERCCIVDLTLIDNEGRIVWSQSVPVIVRRRDDAKNDFEFDGEDYSILHQSDKGDIYMRMNRDPSTKQYSITSAHVKLAAKTVNDWFGTKY